jgi:hypothetical protein
VGESGVDTLTIERLSFEAEIPLEELRGHYPTAQSALHETFEEVSRGVQDDFVGAFVFERSWYRALALAGRKLLDRMAARPAEARLYFVEILRGDRESLRLREASRQRMVDLFVRELGRRCDGEPPPSMQLELLIGAGFQMIAAAVADGRVAELPELEAELAARASVFDPLAARRRRTFAASTP